MRAVKATWMRGGTSKCWIFEEDDLPPPGAERDQFLLAAFGSPDVRQLDGVGGATSTTSKAVILKPSARAGADVDYTFAQVAIQEAKVDWNGNCGNCSSVTGPYALLAGWVAARGDTTPVRVFNTNTNKLLVAEVDTAGGRLNEAGGHAVVGVPPTGTLVRLWFEDPAGAMTGRLFPTGHPQDVVETDRGPVRVTFVDAGNPVIFAYAPDLGLTGTEMPAAVDADPDLLERLERIRGQASVWMGMSSDPLEARRVSRGIPKVGWVAPPAAQFDLAGRRVEAEAMDLCARMLSMGKAHPAIAITGTIALAAAWMSEGTVVRQVAASHGDTVRVAHPSGVTQLWAEANPDGTVRRVGVLRTARRLVSGTLYLP